MNNLKKQYILPFLALAFIALWSTSCEGPGVIEQNIFLEDTLVVTVVDTIYQDKEVIVTDTLIKREQPSDWELIFGDFNAETQLFIDTVRLYYETSTFEFTISRKENIGNDSLEIIFSESKDLDIQHNLNGVNIGIPYVILSGNEEQTSGFLSIFLDYRQIINEEFAVYKLVNVGYMLSLDITPEDSLLKQYTYFNRGGTESTIPTDLTQDSVILSKRYIGTIPQNSQLLGYYISGSAFMDISSIYPQIPIIIEPMQNQEEDIYLSDNFIEELLLRFDGQNITSISDNLSNITYSKSTGQSPEYGNIQTDLSVNFGDETGEGDMPTTLIVNAIISKTDIETTRQSNHTITEEQNLVLRIAFERTN